MSVKKQINNFDELCDGIIFYSLCLAVLFLPVSIAILDTCAGVAVLFFLLKRGRRLTVAWPAQASSKSWGAKIDYIWQGFCPQENFLNRPLQLLALTFAVSVVFSQFPQLSLLAYFGKLLKCVGLYFCFLEVINDQKRIWIFLSFLFFSALITSLSGMTQHYTGRDFLKGHTFGIENFESTQRVNSSFAGANGFGAYLLLVIALVAHLLFSAMGSSKSWILKVGGFMLLVLLLSCLCWTYSRSAWVGYLLILLIMVIMDRRKILFASVLFLIFFFIFLPSLSQIRNLNLFNDNSTGNKFSYSSSLMPNLYGSGSGRLQFWGKAVSIIRTSPIYGTGLNTYTRVLLRDTPPKHIWYAHNCYLQLTAETGILGLGAFLWLVYMVLAGGFNNCRFVHEPWALSCLQGCVSGLAGFLVQSFFDNTFYTVQLSMLMWMFFGLTVALTRFKPSH